VDEIASASAIRDIEFDGTISCGIPGHDRPGRESISNLVIAEGPLRWSYEARCGFASFEYYG
jgi:hypothetical protein